MLRYLPFGKSTKANLASQDAFRPDCWRRWLGRDPLQQLLRIAERERRKGNLQGSISTLSEVLQQFPGYSQALVERGMNYAALNKHDDAILDFDQAIESDPDNSQAWYERGLSWLELRRYKAAIADFTMLIQMKPEKPQAYALLGLAYYFLADFSLAIAYCDQAIQLDRDFGCAYLMRGLARREQGNLQKALSNIQHAQKIFKAKRVEHGCLVVAEFLNSDQLQLQEKEA